MPRINPVDEGAIPEVQEFIKAKEELDQFRQIHERIFQMYYDLLNQYNQKLQDADKKVRALGISCGDWEYYQEQKTYDAKVLYESLGREEFLQVGGTLKTVTEFGLDKNKLEAAFARGDIPPELIEQVRKVTKKYHAPKPV